MVIHPKKIDEFSRNVLIVFASTSLVNFFNLLYQLLIAHRLSAADFASFNSLLSILVVASAPLATLQMAITKYSCDFHANNQESRVRFLLSDFLQKALFFSALTLLVFWLAGGYIMSLLKIPSQASGYLLAALLATAWLSPVFCGGVQGLELFGYFSFGSLASGLSKLALAFFLVSAGYGIAGALGALLAANLVFIFVFVFALKKYISWRAVKENIPYAEIFAYMFPVAVSYFCYMNLVNSDMILVKYYFTAQESGLYSVAQMAGKIFLFLPGAVSMVMFPRTSHLTAKKMDTLSTLKKSLAYVFILCCLAALFYNLFPALVLRVLTGKVFPESLALGRLFSISMTFFNLAYIFIAYFLSLKELRFVKYLVACVIAQNLAIILAHNSLFTVQWILCLNSILLFLLMAGLAYKRRG